MARGNDGDHTLASFAQASPARRAQLLGTPNVIMAGPGVPNDQQLARAQTESVKHAPQIAWEILPDGDAQEYHDKFEYTQRVAQLQKLKADYPNIKAVLLDDMTSVAVDKGFKPEHLRTLKKHLSAEKQPVELWGVFYTMNFHRPNINEYIGELDVINLWTWHAKDLLNLEKNVAYCKQQFPGKPIVLGLYLRDYGDGRAMPQELLELQCETALKLAHRGDIEGIAFLTIDNDEPALKWTADWIKRVGGQRLGARQAENRQLLRGNCWTWGNPEMATPGPHTSASFVQAGPAERAKLLGTENIILAGDGVPLEYDKAEQITADAATAKRLIWEILPDDVTDEYNATSKFNYQRRLNVVCRLAGKYPQLEAVLLDDMSTVAVAKGFKPEHIQGIRKHLQAKGSNLAIWGVVYIMNLKDAHLRALVNELDVILLCEWHGAKLVDLEANVRRAREMFPDKPIVLGTYLYDYGAGRRLPRELLDRQYAAALKLVREGVVEGVEFTTIDNDADAVERTARWIAQVGNQRVVHTTNTQRCELTFPGFDFSMAPHSRPDRLTSWKLYGDGCYDKHGDDAYWAQSLANSHWIGNGDDDPAFAATQGVVRGDMSLVFAPGMLGQQANFSNWQNFVNYASAKQQLQFCILPTDNGAADALVVYTPRGERYEVYSPPKAVNLDDGNAHTYSFVLNFDRRKISFLIDDVPLRSPAGDTEVDLEVVADKNCPVNELKFGGGTQSTAGKARFTHARLAIVSPQPDKTHRVTVRPPENVDDDAHYLKGSGDQVFQTDGSLQGYQLRFNTDRAYQDFEADFTISMPTGHADIGLIVRAQDPRHYYLVHFPQCGQAFRAQHFWGAISKADGSGFLRILKLQHIRRVASNPYGLTHQVNIKVAGNRIQVKVNGFEAMEVIDDTYQQGYLGLSGFAAHQHGRIKITGEPVENPPAFDTKNVQPRNWFEPFGDLGGRHVVPKAALTPAGNLVCLVHAGGRYKLARSEDKGRTWAIQDAPQAFATDNYRDDYGTLYTDLQSFDDGSMVAIHLAANEGAEFPAGFRAVSTDDGRTWSKVELKTDVPWKRETKTLSTGWMFRLRNNDLIRFGLGSHKSSTEPITKWGAVAVQGFAIRSTDRGASWSTPTNLDTDAKSMGNLDLTEPVGFERTDGKLIALIRPVYSPWMWETWSHDGGQTWGPCVRGPFPGYAPSVPVRTESGLVMVPVRFPGLTIHTTTDDGMTWDNGGGGTYVDTSIWAMGSMVEVEPNLVLLMYMDSFGGKTRAQYIRVLPDGTLQPATQSAFKAASRGASNLR